MTTLHTIITGFLLQKRYPIHFYVEFLIYISRGLAELHFDTLGNIRTKRLPLNSYGAITFPCDYMALAGVYSVYGQYKVPLVNRTGLSRLNNYDTDGSKIPYPGLTYSSPAASGDIYLLNGDNMGRNFGDRSDVVGGYRVIPERGEIQINAALAEVVVEYISDGTEIDNATQIDPYAIATLEAYMEWKHKEHSTQYREGERVRAQRQFDYEHRKLRGRKGITMQEIKGAFNRHSTGSPR